MVFVASWQLQEAEDSTAAGPFAPKSVRMAAHRIFGF